MKNLEHAVTRVLIFAFVAYMLIFIPKLHPETSDELAYKYTTRPAAVVEYVNEHMTVTNSNCKKVSDLIYTVLSKCPQLNARYIGVWKNSDIGHAIVTYNDKWGDLYYCTTARINGKWVVDIKKARSIRDACNKWNPDWTHYFEYGDGVRILTVRNGK